MIWLWIVLGLFVGVPVVASVVGLFVPARQRSTREVVLDAPRSKVWAVLTEFEQHPKWRKEIKSVERAKSRGKQPVWREKLPDGREFLIATVEMNAPERLVRELIDARPSMNARWIYELEEQQGKTRLRLSEECQTQVSGMRVLKLLIRTQSQSVNVMLESLRERFG